MFKKIILLSSLLLLLSLVGCKHSHDYIKDVITPTCTTDGYTIYTCSCGETLKKDYIYATGHMFSEWVIEQEPTYENVGIKRRECNVCGFIEQENIPELNHTHKYTEEVFVATCQEEGYTKYTCSCGDTYIDDIVEKLDHEYGEFVVILEPTEHTEGLKEKTCIVCQDKVVEKIPTLSHQHEYTEEVFVATCQEEGYTKYTCSCGDTYIDDIVEKLDHEYLKEIISPTCTMSGYTIFTCTKCKDSYKDDYIAKMGHDYEAWVEILPPTTTTEGQKERECSRCGTKETESVPLINVPDEVQITYDLNGGLLSNGYTSLEALCNAFLKDYNTYGNTNATLSNFLKDTSSSIKTSLSKRDMLEKWQWLFAYMYEDIKEYNTTQDTINVSYVADALELFPKLIAMDTDVIKDSTKGPNFRTLIRSYLHGMMNLSKGDPVGNETFAKYVPDFSISNNRYDLLLNQYNLKVTFKRGDILPIPVREEYKFIGWFDEFSKLITIPDRDMKLTAIWEEETQVNAINITNEINELNVHETYQLIWKINPSNAFNQKVRFESSDTSIASISSEGLITTNAIGVVTIRIISLSLSGVSDEFTLNVVTPGYFDISYETTSFVTIDSVIKLNASYITGTGTRRDVTWESLNNDIAFVDAEGAVVGLKEGVAYIRAKYNEQTYQDFLVTVVSKAVSEDLQVVLDAHVSNVFVEYNLGIGAGTPVYYMDILGSVSKLLYNEALTIDMTYNKATNDKYGSELQNRLLDSVEFITVHYTGSMSSGDTAAAIAKYFAKPLSSVKTSIHYCTGNDGIFKGIDETYRAAHAGDDGSLETVAEFSWIDTPVTVLSTDPKIPVVTITKNATFAINGRDTLISVPVETKFGRGKVTDSKWLNDMGLAVNIKNGKYQLGTSWWCYTQVWEGRICSNGGNRNSIGIESAVNKGSDLWYTWQKTAMLCADIMNRYNLDITRVKGHHFFSAKDCPQPMLENNLEIWWEFLELVESEYARLTKCPSSNFTFYCDSSYINNKGRVLRQDNESKLVEYTVIITNGNTSETITLGSIIPGTYNK